MSELPRGWVLSSLGELVDYGTTAKVEPADIGSDEWVLELEDIEKHTSRLLQHLSSRDRTPKSTKNRFSTGDVLYGKLRPYLNKVLLATEGGVCTTEVVPLRCPAGLLPSYLFYALKRSDFLDYVAQACHGIDMPRLGTEAGRAADVPLPPLVEQRRIVAKIDSLTTKSRRARDHLDHIPRLVEKYKQAVLAAAFRGDLTREWHERSSAAAWQRTRLGAVVKIASGQTPKGIEARLSSHGELPWFKVSSMNEPGNLAGLRTSQFRLSRQDAGALGLRVVAAGSVAFPKRGGAIATNKKRKLLVDGALDLNLMVLTATNISADFLWWWMQKLDLASISNGSNVPQINNGDIAPLSIEVPSAAEQAEIARLLGIAFTWIDRLVAEATSARRLTDKLDQAVLAKAFRGELVPQDPDDEPASALLDRIRAERGMATKAKRGRQVRAG